MNAAIQLPCYICHKQVHALKIAEVFNPDPVDIAGVSLHPLLRFEDDRFASMEVAPEWIAKHSPEAGGYYVVYDDGYTSFSPAEAFESGYSYIDNEMLKAGMTRVMITNKSDRAIRVHAPKQQLRIVEPGAATFVQTDEVVSVIEDPEMGEGETHEALTCREAVEERMRELMRSQGRTYRPVSFQGDPQQFTLLNLAECLEEDRRRAVVFAKSAEA